MMNDTMELIPPPQEISLIPLERKAQRIITQGRHRIIRHKREHRDRCIYVIAALIYAWLGVCVGFCGASAYFMWALGVIR